MKKLLFYILLAVSVYLLVSVISLFYRGLDTLTDFGYGYLTGQLILLIIIGLVAYKIKPKKLI